MPCSLLYFCDFLLYIKKTLLLVTPDWQGKLAHFSCSPVPYSVSLILQVSNNDWENPPTLNKDLIPNSIWRNLYYNAIAKDLKTSVSPLHCRHRHSWPHSNEYYL